MILKSGGFEIKYNIKYFKNVLPSEVTDGVEN